VLVIGRIDELDVFAGKVELDLAAARVISVDSDGNGAA
jgi:hypothetical protein